MKLHLLLAALAILLSCRLAQAAEGEHGHYAVLTANPDTPAPFAAVDLSFGPSQKVGNADYCWWQLEVRAENKADSPPLFALRALTSRSPLADTKAPLVFSRYILRIPADGPAIEYRNIHTNQALLPAWKEFERYFIPAPGTGADHQDGLAQTATYLGHTLTLQSSGSHGQWQPWPEPKILQLDPELLVGTGRNFRDKELARLPQKPQRQDYHYIPFTQPEYRTMIDAGINLFIVDAQQTPWVSSEPVFFIRDFGSPGLNSYPADLYRSNYIGPVMFMDEPGILMVGDRQIHNTLRYFSDAATVLMQRVRNRYDSGGSYSACALETSLRKLGIGLGDMRIEQWDYPAWETLYPLAHYELAAGLAGIVHEGRYQLGEFDAQIARWLDRPRKHTPEEMLRYHYAFLRGAARINGGNWGTSIYGQADPALSPLAVTLAYDMGARYVWFWTSDHDHHLPWPEQLALARHLKEHAAAHPRPSIHAPATVDVAIAIPPGSFLELGNLWWVRSLDKEGKNQASQRYARLMRRSHAAIEQAMQRKEDFDVIVSDQERIPGYRQVVRINAGE